MKRLYYYFIIILILVTTGFREGYSQNPTYQLRATNFVFTSGCGYWNSMDFDIYMQNTSGSPLEYSAGQYFFNFNPAIANGGVLSYEIVSSDLPVNLRPRNPSIGTVSNPPATILRLGANPAAPPGSGYLISGSYPGTKIVTMRLRTSAISFVEDMQPDLAWRNPPSMVNTLIFANVNGTTTNITDTINHSIYLTGPIHCLPQVLPWDCCRFFHAISISSLIEGLYDPNTNRLNRKDTITIEVRNGYDPSSIYSSKKLTLDSVNLSSYFVFIGINVDPLYIVIKHFNSIETWSNVAREYDDDYLYYFDFTNYVGSAYGDNLKPVGNRYAVYSGDVNRDKVIDALDQALVDIAYYNYETGRFLPADLNGDNVVDSLDVVIADNNVYNYVTPITPLN